MNKEILTQFKTHLSKIGLDAQNVQKRDPARASLKQKRKKKINQMIFHNQDTGIPFPSDLAS